MTQYSRYLLFTQKLFIYDENKLPAITEANMFWNITFVCSMFSDKHATLYRCPYVAVHTIGDL